LTLTHLGLAELTAKPTGACDDTVRNYYSRGSYRIHLCCEGLDSYKDLRQQNDSSERTKTH